MIPKSGDKVRVNPEVDFSVHSRFNHCCARQDQKAGCVLDIISVETHNIYNCLLVRYKSRLGMGMSGKGRGAFITEEGCYYDATNANPLSHVVAFIPADSSPTINKISSSCSHSDVRRVYVGEWIDVCHVCKQEVKQ